MLINSIVSTDIMKYISLKNGILFRTAQSYTWISSNRSGRSLVEMTENGNNTIPVDGEVLLLPGTGWTEVKKFKCESEDIQATWED